MAIKIPDAKCFKCDTTLEPKKDKNGDFALFCKNEKCNLNKVIGGYPPDMDINKILEHYRKNYGKRK